MGWGWFLSFFLFVCWLLLKQLFRIRSNYRTYPYKRTVKKFRSLQITASVIFLYFFLKACICCGYSFELHQLVDAIQMSAHNICLYKENQKQSHNHHQISPFSDLFYCVSLVGRYIFYHKWVFPVILKNLSAQCGNYCPFNIFWKVVFCLALYTEEVNLQTFVMI